MSNNGSEPKPRNIRITLDVLGASKWISDRIITKIQAIAHAARTDIVVLVTPLEGVEDEHHQNNP